VADETATTTTLSAESAALQAARARRADLRHVLVDLEASLAAPMANRVGDWAMRVHDTLVDVAAAFERHIAVTEGPGGLFTEVRTAAPRLAKALEQLSDDHARVRREMADKLEVIRDVIASTDRDRARQVRADLVDVLGALTRHRQEGADLVYEAYAVDIGVGD
jgi:hypothetical protein